MLMNIVREPCLYEYLLTLKNFFFVFSERSNTMTNTNILKRIFFQSVYFLENSAEISFMIAGLLSVYMVFATLHLMLYKPKGAVSKRFEKLLSFFEFGFFIRMQQVLITPLTYFCFWGLRNFTYPNYTAVFDVLMCFLYSFIILLLVFIVVYILNFQESNMEE